MEDHPTILHECGAVLSPGPGKPEERCTWRKGHPGLEHNWPSMRPIKDRMLQDAVNHPQHYGGKENPHETIKCIEAWGLGYALGNAVKYISRAGKKHDNIVEDLKKAEWYIRHEIERLENESKA